MGFYLAFFVYDGMVIRMRYLFLCLCKKYSWIRIWADVYWNFIGCHKIVSCDSCWCDE